MQIKSKQPFVPQERHETIRREIIALLQGNTLSAKDISTSVRISEKEAYDHLEHIQRSANQEGHHLIVTPAECRKCGFAFKKRERLKKPGKCPVCRSESIAEPLFAIKKAF